MIVLDAISTETAENARKSLVEQAEGGRAAEPEQTLTQKRNDKPYTILKDAPEVVRACDEFAKVCRKQGLITTTADRRRGCKSGPLRTCSKSARMKCVDD